MDTDAPKGRVSDRWSDMSDAAVAADAARRLALRANTPSEVEARRRALDLLDPRPGEIVIDVGAGSGDPQSRAGDAGGAGRAGLRRRSVGAAAWRLPAPRRAPPGSAI